MFLEYGGIPMKIYLRVTSLDKIFMDFILQYDM